MEGRIRWHRCRPCDCESAAATKKIICPNAEIKHENQNSIEKCRNNDVFSKKKKNHWRKCTRLSCQKMERLDELLYREEMMWLQRSRIMWLKEGNWNTQYFHKHAIWRARKNNIRRLQKADGSWCNTSILFPRSVYQRPHLVSTGCVGTNSLAMKKDWMHPSSMRKFRMPCFK